MVRCTTTCCARSWRTMQTATNWPICAPRRQQGKRGSGSTAVLIFILSNRLRWRVHIKSGTVSIPNQPFSLAVTAFQDHSWLEMHGTWRNNASSSKVPWLLNAQTAPTSYGDESQKRLQNLAAGTAQHVRTGLLFESMKRSPTCSVPSTFPEKNSPPPFFFKEFVTSPTHAKSHCLPIFYSVKLRILGQPNLTWSSLYTLFAYMNSLGRSILLIILFSFNPWTKIHIHKTVAMNLKVRWPTIINMKMQQCVIFSLLRCMSLSTI